MDEDDTVGVSTDYGQVAHEARLQAIQQLRDDGCCCHPFLAVAVVQNVYDELVTYVKVEGHEAHCPMNVNMIGRVN